MPAKTRPATPDFEKALNELEKLVERMEQGELSLEESLKSFERGMVLSRQCQGALEQAQQRVDQVLEKDGEVHVGPLETDAEESPDKDDDKIPY